MTDHQPSSAAGARRQDEPGLDRAFDALAHPYRRRILTTIAEGKSRDEIDFSPEQLHANDDLELFTSQLYHVHLPKLEEAEYVAWDRDTGTITRGPNFEEIAPLVELIRNHRDELPADWP